MGACVAGLEVCDAVGSGACMVGGMHSCGREFIMFVATSVIWAITRFFFLVCFAIFSFSRPLSLHLYNSVYYET